VLTSETSTSQVVAFVCIGNCSLASAYEYWVVVNYQASKSTQNNAVIALEKSLL